MSHIVFSWRSFSVPWRVCWNAPDDSMVNGPKSGGKEKANIKAVLTHLFKGLSKNQLLYLDVLPSWNKDHHYHYYHCYCYNYYYYHYYYYYYHHHHHYFHFSNQTQIHTRKFVHIERNNSWSIHWYCTYPRCMSDHPMAKYSYKFKIVKLLIVYHLTSLSSKCLSPFRQSWVLLKVFSSPSSNTAITNQSNHTCASHSSNKMFQSIIWLFTSWHK